MTLFITSSPYIDGAPRAILSNQNEFIDRIRAVLPGNPQALFICADPDDHDGTCRFAAETTGAFAEAGIGYRQCVENLASGQSTAQQVVNAWTRSASHNANLLDPTIRYMRVAVGVTPNGMPYWVFVAYG